MKPKVWQVLMLVGVILLVVGLAPSVQQSLVGDETYSYPASSHRLPFIDAVSVWWKTGDYRLAYVYFTLFSGVPPNQVAVTPQVSCSHVAGDAWQGTIFISGPSWQLLEDVEYYFGWLGVDVNGVPVLIEEGIVSFHTPLFMVTVQAPYSAGVGVSLPKAGMYQFVNGEPLIIYGYATEGYRLSGWTINGQNVAVATNPLVYQINLDSVVKPNFALNQPPDASFEVSTTQLYVGQTLYCDASLSTDMDGGIARYSWDWADASTSNGVTANHVYSVSGTYVIQLTVTDVDGCSNAEHQSITVLPALDMEEPVTYSFKVEAGEGGTTTPVPGVYEVTGDSYMVTALPESGYVVRCWFLNGELKDASDTLLVLVDEDTVVRVEYMLIGQEGDGVFILPQPNLGLAGGNIGLTLVGAGCLIAAVWLRRRKQ